MASIRSSWPRLLATRSQLDLYLLPSSPRPSLPNFMRPDLDLLMRALQDDLDLQDDPRYAAMFLSLSSSLRHRQRLNTALWRPAAIPLSRPYPLYASELSFLCDTLGFSVSAKTIERLALAGLISPPCLIGAAKLPRPVYFARHLLEVLYEQTVLNLKPVQAQAYKEVLSGRLHPSLALYFSSLPGVLPALLPQATLSA